MSSFKTYYPKDEDVADRLLMAPERQRLAVKCRDAGVDSLLWDWVRKMDHASAAGCGWVRISLIEAHIMAGPGRKAMKVLEERGYRVSGSIGCTYNDVTICWAPPKPTLLQRLFGKAKP